MSRGATRYRTTGRVLPDVPRKVETLTAIHGTITDGCVINAGSACGVLSCVGSEPGVSVQLVNLAAYETFATGSAVKLALRVYYFSANYTLPAKGSAWKAPAAITTLVGYVDIRTANYIEADNDAVATNGFAVAFKTIHRTSDRDDGMGIWMPLDPESNKLYTAVVAREGSKTIALNASLTLVHQFQSA